MTRANTLLGDTVARPTTLKFQSKHNNNLQPRQNQSIILEKLGLPSTQLYRFEIIRSSLPLTRPISISPQNFPNNQRRPRPFSSFLSTPFPSHRLTKFPVSVCFDWRRHKLVRDIGQITFRFLEYRGA